MPEQRQGQQAVSDIAEAVSCAEGVVAQIVREDCSENDNSRCRRDQDSIERRSRISPRRTVIPEGPSGRDDEDVAEVARDFGVAREGAAFVDDETVSETSECGDEGQAAPGCDQHPWCGDQMGAGPDLMDDRQDQEERGKGAGGRLRAFPGKCCDPDHEQAKGGSGPPSTTHDPPVGMFCST